MLTVMTTPNPTARFEELLSSRARIGWGGSVTTSRAGSSPLYEFGGGYPDPASFPYDGLVEATAKMMKADCKAAGIPHKNEHGIADFHALRTTFITNTCRLTDQFTAMRLIRHTKAAVTARHYDKVLLSQRAKVVEQLQLPAPI